MLSFSAMCLKATVSTLEMSQASAITISRRMPMLARLAFWPDHKDMLEANRMVVEKFEAIAESAMAATEQATAVTMRALLGKSDAEDMASGMVSIAVAASAPLHKRARANARRLSKD